MSDIEKYAITITNILDDVEKLNNKLHHIEPWTIRGMVDSVSCLMDRFCPFAINEPVKLVRPFTTKDKSHGWYTFQHFMVEGAKAVVKHRGYDPSEDVFTFTVNFDLETTGDGKQVESDQRHQFVFNEYWLAKVMEPTNAEIPEEDIGLLATMAASLDSPGFTARQAVDRAKTILQCAKE